MVRIQNNKTHMTNMYNIQTIFTESFYIAWYDMVY